MKKDINIFEVKLELSEFIRKNPELVFYQKYIENTLKKAGNSPNRIVMLSRLINDNLQELQKQLLTLQKKLEVLK